jgi:hypothetical protein
MMFPSFNLVPNTTLFLFMAASMSWLALAKQGLGLFVSQDQDIEQALQTSPLTDKLQAAAWFIYSCWTPPADDGFVG